MNRLARALVPIAHRALSLPVGRPTEDEPLLAIALDAIDGFLAAPVASRYLSAARALSELTRLRKRSAQVDVLARRSLARELDRLDTLIGAQRADGNSAANEAEPNMVELLRSLPPDPRAGRRVQALAALLEAHHTLAIRVRAPEQHRARIALPDGGEAPAIRRAAGRVADRRNARVPRKRRA